MSIHLNQASLPPLHFCTCSKPGPRFVYKNGVFSDFKREVVVHFYCLRGIVDHHFVNFLFIMQLLYHIIRRCMLVFDPIFEENVVHIRDEGESGLF